MTSTEHLAARTYRELLEINRLITSSLDHSVVLSTVTTEAARLVNGDAAALLLREGGALHVAATHALDVPAGLPLRLGPQIMTQIRELGTSAGLVGSVGVPLVLHGQTIGVLAVYGRAAEAPSAADENILSALADQAAIALENARVHRQLELQTAALRNSEERFRLAFEGAPIGVALVSIEGRYMRVNRALCKLLGYTRDELLQLRIQDLMHRDDVAEDLVLLQRLARGVVPRYQLTKRYVRKDGVVIDVLAHRSVVRGVHGEPLYFITHLDDVTEQKQAERERSDALRRLQAVLDGAPVGILLTHDGHRWYANGRAQRLFGQPIDASAHFDQLLDTDDNPLGPDLFPGARALRGEKLEGIELHLRTPEGKIIPLLVTAAQIPRVGTEPPGAVVAFEDISSLKELERLRTEWSSVIAHDLRQPLNTIAMATELAVAQTDNAAVQRRLALIQESVRRLGRMIHDLLDFSRLAVRQLRLDRRIVDVSALVHEATNRIGLEAPDRPIAVRSAGPPALIDVDPDRFQQIMENLLTNAIKYGAPSTPIEVEIEVKGDTVMVSVINHGPGIDPDQLPHLFQRFQTVNEARSSGRSIGLGLYITRELVEAHGGTIAAESVAGGTTIFRFTLPVVSPVSRAVVGEAHPPA